MLKKDVLLILTASQIARKIKKHPAQVTRMPAEVPDEYQGVLMGECKKRVRTLINALERMKK